MPRLARPDGHGLPGWVVYAAGREGWSADELEWARETFCERLPVAALVNQPTFVFALPPWCSVERQRTVLETLRMLADKLEAGRAAMVPAGSARPRASRPSRFA